MWASNPSRRRRGGLRRQSSKIGSQARFSRRPAERKPFRKRRNRRRDGTARHHAARLRKRRLLVRRTRVGKAVLHRRPTMVRHRHRLPTKHAQRRKRQRGEQQQRKDASDRHATIIDVRPTRGNAWCLSRNGSVASGLCFVAALGEWDPADALRECKGDARIAAPWSMSADGPQVG